MQLKSSLRFQRAYQGAARAANVELGAFSSHPHITIGFCYLYVPGTALPWAAYSWDRAVEDDHAA
jgi:hypothetical protein